MSNRFNDNEVTKQDIEDNQEDISKANYMILKMLTIVLVSMCSFIFLISLLVPSYHTMRISYAITLLCVGISTLFVKKVENNSKRTLQMLYFMFVLIGLFCIYLSIDVSPHSRATILLGMLCATPLLIIDANKRVSRFVFGIFLLHSILAYFIKSPQIFVDDIINGFVFVVLGSIIGNNNRKTKIKNFVLQRQTLKLAEIDFLTGLYNRRKMYEYMMNDNKPICGIVLFDIDDFKGFNDYYGHQVGDQCLKSIGKFLIEFGKRNQMVFFRFGGEEFLGFDFSRDFIEMKEITEKLRQQIIELNIEYDKYDTQCVTVSIGYTVLDEKNIDIEHMITLSDKALYQAKLNGKNCCMGLK